MLWGARTGVYSDGLMTMQFPAACGWRRAGGRLSVSRPCAIPFARHENWRCAPRLPSADAKWHCAAPGLRLPAPERA